MGKILLSFFAFYVPFVGSSQYSASSLAGNWVAFKKEMRNGSAFSDAYMTPDSFFMLSLSNGKASQNFSSPAANMALEVPYSVNGDILKTTEFVKFRIERFSSDTLVMTTIEPNLPSSEKRLFFTSYQKYVEKELSKASGNEVFLASGTVTPRLKTKMETRFLKFSAKVSGHFEMTGKIRLDVLQNKIELLDIESDLDSKSLTSKIQEALKIAEDWDATLFERFRYIDIPFEVVGNRVGSFSTIGVRFGNEVR